MEQKQVNRLVARAEKLVRANRNRGAAKLFKKIARLDPDNPRWPRKEGDALQRLRRTSDAVRAYEQATAQHLGLNEQRHALALCDLILNLAPDNMEVRLMARRLRATSRSWSDEQERRLNQRVSAQDGIPETNQAWPTVGEVIAPSDHSVDVARAQAMAIKEAAATGQGLATWSPPETTPMVDLSSEIETHFIEFDHMDPTGIGVPPQTPAGERVISGDTEIETMPVADDPYNTAQPSLDDFPVLVADDPNRTTQDSLDDIPIIVDVPAESS